MPHVERGGVRIHYESFGRGEPVVLLHPIATNRYFWASSLFGLAKDRRVVVLDHRGHGLSDRPREGYGVPSMSADLLAVLDDAGIDRATLVGNSIGGMIAVQAALDAPERVRALVVVSSATGLAPHVPHEVLVAYRERFEATFDFVLEGATSARTKRERPEVGAWLRAAHRVRDAFAPEVFLASLDDPDGVFGWSVAERLAAVRQPALVLAGEEDRAMPLDAVRRLAEGIAGARFRVVPEVGHFYPLERPAEFTDELRAFLDGIGG